MKTRLHILAALLLATISFSGCASMAAFHNSRTVGFEVIHTDTDSAAIVQAADVVRQHPGWIMSRTAGTGSMATIWHGKAWAVFEPARIENVQIGNVVVFDFSKSLRIIHTTVARDSGGLITAGAANHSADRGRVTNQNIVGVARFVFIAQK